MKVYSHTKKQLIALIVLVVIFLLTVLYSKGYFDFTFVDRPGSIDSPVTQRRDETTVDPSFESAYDDDYFGEDFEDHFGDYEDYFDYENDPYIPEGFVTEFE